MIIAEIRGTDAGALITGAIATIVSIATILAQRRAGALAEGRSGTHQITEGFGALVDDLRRDNDRLRTDVDRLSLRIETAIAAEQDCKRRLADLERIIRGHGDLDQKGTPS